MFESLSPVSILKKDQEQVDKLLAHVQLFHEEGDLEEGSVAIIFCFQALEDDFSIQQNSDHTNRTQAVISELAKLADISFKQKPVIMGELLPSDTFEGTMQVLSLVLQECLENKLIPLVIGNSGAVSYSAYQAFGRLDQAVNFINVDSKFDINTESEELYSNENYLLPVFTDSPNYLNYYGHLAYQSHYLSKSQAQILERLHFDFFRLSEVQRDQQIAEILLRDADLANFDCSAIRNSDCPAAIAQNPNGLFSEEFCQYLRYAGISDRLQACVLTGIHPDSADEQMGIQLLAQSIWYFLEGYSLRTNEYPLQLDQCSKFTVFMEQADSELIFLKSRLSGRWWLEVYRNGIKEYLACTEFDYQQAINGELPDRWFKAYARL